MPKFTFVETDFRDLYIIQPAVFEDERGYFLETYNENEFKKPGLNVKFVQDNQSKSKKGVLRGLHFQYKHPQGKLVRVIAGKVFDVVVDLRGELPGYGQWFGQILSAENKKQLYIPAGFAHGFLVLSEEAIVTYKCTDFYYPEDEGGIIWNDEDIGIEWPLDEVEDIYLSEKDKKWKTLADSRVSF